MKISEFASPTYAVIIERELTHECGQELLASTACALMKVKKKEENQIEKEKQEESTHV